MARPQRKYSEKEKLEIKKAYKESKNVKEKKRLLCLKLRIEKGSSSKEIAEIVDFTESFVKEIISKYTKLGLPGIMAKKQGGNHRNLTVEQEIEFLKVYIEQAEAGKIVEVNEIIKDYEKLIGRPVKKSVVYRMLHRQGWRKIMPRNKHPQKANVDDVEAYKKNH